MTSSLLGNLTRLCAIVGILSSSSAFAPSRSRSSSTTQRVRMVDRATMTTTRLQGTVTPNENHRREALSRRKVLSSAVLLGGFGGFLQSAKAEESEDLTSQLYNPDGSLKSLEEAKSRTITVKLGLGSVATDGVVSNKKTDSSGGDGANEGLLEISYEVPAKWSPDYMSLNPTKGVTVQACDHIYVYSVPYDASVLPLSKASTAGVAKTLQLGTVLSSSSSYTWDTADVMGGKRLSAESQRFDLAVAPKTCSEGSANNLGLGFCPYNKILLISTTIVTGDTLVTLLVEANDEEWKGSNSDLRRVRDSFRISSV